AEALGVSRQSVSKWETGGSVPDLDKLVKLSQLFGVSLDELVLDRKPPYEEAPPQEAPQEAPPPVTVVVQRERTPGRKVAGVVLLCMAFLVLLLLTAMGGPLEGLVLALPFLLCAAICFLARRRSGLWCAWTMYYLADVYLICFTGLRWRFLFVPATYAYYSGAHFISAAVQVALMLALIAATARSFRNAPLSAARRNKLLLLAGAAGVVVGPYLLSLLTTALYRAGVHWAVTPLSALQDLLALYLAAAVVTGAVRMWRTRRAEKSENQ
ncbi:MAG TPA: helix-turn-helix transcriptional regulator, partial [Candidatus Enterenecus avicola]|nr:helix-turn-helix transcriptional regulator [Candidatus Enterenecus avicola]